MFVLGKNQTHNLQRKKKELLPMKVWGQKDLLTDLKKILLNATITLLQN